MGMADLVSRYLLKRSGYLLHSWKARWVVCDPGELCLRCTIRFGCWVKDEVFGRYYSIEFPAQPVDIVHLTQDTVLEVLWGALARLSWARS